MQTWQLNTNLDCVNHIIFHIDKVATESLCTTSYALHSRIADMLLEE